MPEELKWQTKMVDAVKGAGGYAQKTAHRTKIGVPDLLLKLPDLPAALVEVKHVVLTPGSQIVNIELTKPQALHLDSFTKAGGCAFWVAVLTVYGRRDQAFLLYSNDTKDLKWEMNRVWQKARATNMRAPWGPQFTNFLGTAILDIC